jgi:hypothetical protein
VKEGEEGRKEMKETREGNQENKEGRKRRRKEMTDVKEMMVVTPCAKSLRPLIKSQMSIFRVQSGFNNDSFVALST